MRKKLFILILLLMIGAAYGISSISFQNCANPRRLRSLLQDIHGSDRNTYTFGNGLTINNVTNNALTFTENSEDWIWTYASNAINMTSSTGVTSIDFALLTPKSDQFLCDPVADAVGTTEGTVYYDSDDDTLKYRNASAWVSLTAGTGDNTLDNAYDQGGAGSGRSIHAADGAVRIWSADADSAFLLAVEPNAASSAALGGIQITSTANNTQDCIQVVNSGSGDDIQAGGGAMTVASDGSIVALDLDVTGASGITLQNDETITNVTDTEIAFTDSGSSEDFSVDFVTDEIDFKSSSGVVTVGWGDLDAHTGLNTLTFDAAASSISLPADGAADDFTISVTGNQNSSLILQSAGNAADALQIATVTNGGGIDITANGAAASDLDLTCTNGSINLTSGEAAVDSTVINSSGGIDVDAVDDVVITVTSGSAGEDLQLIQVGANDSSIYLGAGGNGADAIHLLASAGTIKINGDSIDLDTTGDFTLDVTASTAGEDILITQAGNYDASTIISTEGSGTDALTLQTITNGGDIVISSNDKIDMDSTGTFALNAAGDTLLIQVDSDGAGDDLTLKVDGDDDAHIKLDCDGTSGDSISIQTTAGGIDIDSGATGGITMDSGGVISIDAVDDLNLTLTSGTAGEDLTIAVAGTGDSSILMSSIGTGADAISIQVTGDNGDMDIDAADAITVDSNEIAITCDEDKADAIYLHANGGTSETIRLRADQGTGNASIGLTSDVGGMTFTANGANAAGQIIISSALVLDGATTAFTGADATPDVSGHTLFITGGADTYTNFDCGSGTCDVGQIVVVLSGHAATFDTTSTNLSGSSADLVTASGDITMWIFDGTNWRLLQFTDVSADNSGGI